MRKNLYNTLIGQLTKKGEKNKAIKILNSALFKTSLKTKLPVVKLFKILPKKLGSIVETKVVKLKRNVHVVPFPLKRSRRFYLIAKNLIKSLQENKLKIRFKNKLTEELFFLAKKKSQSKSLQKKINLLKQATNNKSNIHYRW